MNMYISFFGKDLNPLDLEKVLDVKLKEKIVKGKIGLYGRFKGKKIPFGSANLQIPESYINKTPYEKINWLVDKVDKISQKIKSFHIEKMCLQIDDAYEYQFNFELDAQQLAKLSELKINLCISAYQKEEINASNIIQQSLKNEEKVKRERAYSFLWESFLTEQNKVLINASNSIENITQAVELREITIKNTEQIYFRRFIRKGAIDKLNNFITKEVITPPIINKINEAIKQDITPKK